MKNLLYDVFQRIIALIILIVLSPLFVLISILIRVNLKTFPIFSQKRIGLNGKEFTIYKFKTLYENTPNNMPTNTVDDYLKYSTKFGLFLRNSSLDETLQLINIIKGDMAFVGPRPVMTNEIELNLKRLELGVYSVKPGITGWAQINGRDKLNIDEKIKYDIEYIKDNSIKFDIYIIYQTLFKVLKREDIKKGAY